MDDDEPGMDIFGADRERRFGLVANRFGSTHLELGEPGGHPVTLLSAKGGEENRCEIALGNPDRVRIGVDSKFAGVSIHAGQIERGSENGSTVTMSGDNVRGSASVQFWDNKTREDHLVIERADDGRARFRILDGREKVLFKVP
jgi:hypothetical protein